ncbi:MAG TPA: aspartate aminotransferase family protein, partial [Bacteroidia bacterium]|nr:aspartate aminotransferase family protein [Bacteroidia bacterium]
YGEYVKSPQVAYAHVLAQHLPPNLQSCYFVNSGSEAIEGALKLAKRVTGRSQIIAFNGAYHGSTHGALSLMSDTYFTSAFRPLLPDITFIDWNNLNQLKLITSKTACVVTEVVRAESGAITPQKGFLQALQAQCNAVGALLICDEIQTGFGRTGPLFGFMDYNIQPDIICLGKGMAGGMPLGAFIASNERMNCLSHNPVLGHITTFGGHPVSCAAAIANLEVIKSLDTEKTIPEKEKIIRTHLKHKAIQSISGKGLMLAVSFKDETFNKSVIKYCIENGVVVDWFLFADNKLRIAPPLIIENDLLEKACFTILDGIEYTYRKLN